MTERPRHPGIVHALLALVLLLLVTALALTNRQPPPPTIAEFAPQAVENITDAPNDQSSSSGRSGGAGGGGNETPTPEPVVQDLINVPRVRRCVGDPPRQIEDPQSPPCVPYWQGDNGGATTKGVTRDEIRIAATFWDDAYHTAMARFFNTRFEFYGRQIRFQRVMSAGDDPSQQRANAVQADESLKVFAALNVDANGSYDYYTELARRRIISSGGRSLVEHTTMSRFAPYMWQYSMAADQLFSHMGDWMCARLSGHLARHTQPPLSMRERKFGIILMNESSNASVKMDPMVAALKRCGVTPGATFTYASNQGTLDPNAAANASLQMQTAGVTSVVCLCHIATIAAIASASTGQGYFPEWLTTTYNVADLNDYIRLTGPRSDQRAHYFGITVMPRQVRPEDVPMMWAFSEGGDPGTDYKVSFRITQLNFQYRSLLLLASGIQMAGPLLTPATFAAALHRTTFPNPEHRIQPGKVGFANASTSMTVDAAEYWWSETATSPYPDEGAGTLCYADGGRRHGTGLWPRSESTVFTLPCDSGA